jgi:hypothetical protein
MGHNLLKAGHALMIYSRMRARSAASWARIFTIADRSAAAQWRS